MKSQYNKHSIQYRYNCDSIGNALGNAAVAKIASYSATEAKKEVDQKSYEKAKAQGKSDKEATAIAVKEMQAASSSANDASSEKQEAEATATRNGAISINGNENGGFSFGGER